MSVVCSVVNQKGGVGKTTTAVNVSASLAHRGKRVLLIDLDPQGNATSGVGLRSAISEPGMEARASIYDVLTGDAPLESAILPTQVANLNAVPSNIDLAGAELDLVSRFSREMVLKRALAPVRDQYDFIVIDCAPSLGLLTVNGLVAADGCIVPIQCEYYALEGVAQLVRVIDLVRRDLNPSLEIARVVLTMYDPRINLSKQVVADVRAAFPNVVSNVLIPRNVRLSEAPSRGLPISEYDPRSRGAKAYDDLAGEMLEYAEARSR
jgi:chromosome partitioning protein